MQIETLFIFVFSYFSFTMIVGPGLLYVLRAYALSPSQQEESFLSASPEQSRYL